MNGMRYSVQKLLLPATGLISAVGALVVVMKLSRRGLVSPVDLGPPETFLVVVMILAAMVGALIARRTQAGPIGPLLMALGVSGILLELAREYGIYALVKNPGSLPFGPEAAWFYDWAWVLVLVWIPPLLLYFPDGSLLSPRWRLVLWANALWAAIYIGLAAGTWPQRGVELVSGPDVRNDQGMLSEFLAAAGGVVLVCVLAACAWSVVRRFRGAGGVERLQLKWLAFSSVVLAIAILVAYYLFNGEVGTLNALANLAIGGLPVSIGIAVFKYRLYDIDVVINKAMVYGTLAAFITAIYVAIVVGIGTLLGVGDEPNLGLSILATALIAVAFQPFKQRVQRLSNRMVYGNRSTPYEVLADFSIRMTGSYAREELLSQMAATLAKGTGAASAHVWIKVGDQLRLAASSHQDSAHSESDEEHHHPIPVPAGELSIPGSDRVAPVVHKGELLGALAVTKRPGEHVTPVEYKLLSDLAAQAGVVLRNVRLTEELLQRLEELKASRQRLVAAQDNARRRLERDLHDGAQQQLVALKVKLSLAQRLTKQEKVKSFLTQLQAEADDTLQTLRDLARGIYPPLLAEKGLPAALVAQANKSALDVRVLAEGVGRYAQEVEAAVYFCCLEALQNVAKYAGPCEVRITLDAGERDLTFEVSDTGCGFEPSAARQGHGIQNMLDRVDALGGELSVTSRPEGGTRVWGRIPVPALEPAA